MRLAIFQSMQIPAWMEARNRCPRRRRSTDARRFPVFTGRVSQFKRQNGTPGSGGGGGAAAGVDVRAWRGDIGSVVVVVVPVAVKVEAVLAAHQVVARLAYIWCFRPIDPQTSISSQL